MISLTAGDNQLTRKMTLNPKKQNSLEHGKELSDSLDNSFDANDRVQLNQEYLN